MKIIAFYLPQFHQIPENDEWWGEGFTEWVNVKKAKKISEDQYQPRVPLDSNYYNLLDREVMKNQFQIAKDYGLYGFCFYHYWFNGKKLLEKPLEAMLNDKELNIPYCLSWANESWTNAWNADQKSKILMKQTYGAKAQWKAHYDYLLKFFQDPNYIKNNNKPLFVIYRPEIIDCLDEMLDYWTQLAVESGFAGIDYAYQHIDYETINSGNDDRFAYNIEYQPTYALKDMRTKEQPVKDLIIKSVKSLLIYIQKLTTLDLIYIFNEKTKPSILKSYGYDHVWQAVLNRNKNVSKKNIAGAFVDWDNTPRKKINGFFFRGSSPEKFLKYMKLQIQNVKKNYSNDMIFLFAWNEWAEGGYLEPDEKYKYAYLEALKQAIEESE